MDTSAREINRVHPSRHILNISGIVPQHRLQRVVCFQTQLKRFCRNQPLEALGTWRRGQTAAVFVQRLGAHVVGDLVKSEPVRRHALSRSDLVYFFERDPGQIVAAVLDELEGEAEDEDFAGGIPVNEVHFDCEVFFVDAVLARGVEVEVHEGVGAIFVGGGALDFDHFDGGAKILEFTWVCDAVKNNGTRGGLADGRVKQDRRLVSPCSAQAAVRDFEPPSQGPVGGIVSESVDGDCTRREYVSWVSICFTGIERDSAPQSFGG